MVLKRDQQGISTAESSLVRLTPERPTLTADTASVVTTTTRDALTTTALASPLRALSGGADTDNGREGVAARPASAPRPTTGRLNAPQKKSAGRERAEGVLNHAGMEQAAHAGKQTEWGAHGCTHLELIGARVLHQMRVASPCLPEYQRREGEREQRTRHQRNSLKESDRRPKTHHSQTAFVGGAGRSGAG